MPCKRKRYGVRYKRERKSFGAYASRMALTKKPGADAKNKTLFEQNLPQPTLRRQRTHKLCARVPVQLALKRYETNINAISPPLHRFYSARAMRCEHKRRVKFHVNFIGAASCNSAIGSLAKGHLVKEIDAPGGQTKLAADAPFG